MTKSGDLIKSELIGMTVTSTENREQKWDDYRRGYQKGLQQDNHSVTGGDSEKQNSGEKLTISTLMEATIDHWR